MIIFSNGCFDLLHVGHFQLLSYCKFLAGKDGTVVVALDSDDKIRKDKGVNRPIFTYEERAFQLVSTGLVHGVKKFNTNEELYELIKILKPAILVKGEDWKGNVVGSDVVEKVVYVPVDKRFSTTKIVDKVLNKYLDWREDE
jgi:D-beta-D-heptose 7-phosphate kinase/D-beta-D-heptose 1-phosphate adenosyltransferase